MPIDETRYMAVIWEMWARGNQFLPTLNFQPYYQKAPLLFWLIELGWSLFGVSRAAAMAVLFAIAALIMLFVQRLGVALFPGRAGMRERMPWIVLGSVAFALYATVILFDLLLTACVLAAVLAAMRASRDKGLAFTLLTGFCIGLGLLAKGPVVVIHLLVPFACYPLWRDEGAGVPPRQFYRRMLLALGVGFVVVCFWLVPAFYQAGTDFAYNLIWKQSVGRVNGTVESAHVRPFYFYLAFVPVLLLPWALSPHLWRVRPIAMVRRMTDRREKRILAYLAIWIVWTFVVFSLISGKQPHYIVPVLAPVCLLFGYFLADGKMSLIRMGAGIVIAAFVVGQAIAALTIFKRYDLEPLAGFVAAHQDAEWGFAGQVRGEITFLARLRKPLVVVDPKDPDAWLKAAPNRYLIQEVDGPGKQGDGVVMRQPMRGDWFVVKASPPAAQ